MLKLEKRIYPIRKHNGNSVRHVSFSFIVSEKYSRSENCDILNESSYNLYYFVTNYACKVIEKRILNIAKSWELDQIGGLQFLLGKTLGKVIITQQNIILPS